MAALSNPFTYLIVFGILAALSLLVKLVIVIVTIKGTSPGERPAILKTLPSIFTFDSPGVRPSAKVEEGARCS